jgi:hypothetical protein
MEYKDKLKDPRWISRKREILIRDKYTCKLCGSRGSDGNELHVHHIKYVQGCEPWEYNDWCLVTLCDRCHQAVHKNNIRLCLSRSMISNDFICDEIDADWDNVQKYDDKELLIHQGTILASDDINKIFVAARYPNYHYTDYNGEYKLPFTQLPRNTEVEALFTLDKEDCSLAINEYVFPLDGMFGIHPRYATAEERKMIRGAICSAICFDDIGE